MTPQEIHRMRYMREAQGLDLAAIASIIGYHKTVVHSYVRDLSMIRTCKGCGEKFETRNGKQYNCSRKCRDA